MRTPGMNQPIVVGVDGSDDARRAVEFAVQEAQRCNRGIRLVHAICDTVPLTPVMPLLASERLHDIARGIVTEATKDIDRLSDGEVRSEAVLETAPVVEALLDAADDASMVVLGHRRLHGYERIVSSRTTVGVAARANCPVVSVTPGWEPCTTYGRVVVGVDGSGAAREVLAAAFAAASSRGARLHVVHAWHLPPAYDDLAVSRDVAAEWLEATEPVLSEILAGWRTDNPDVAVDVDLRYEQPVEALVQASASADLLLIGRHGHGWLHCLAGSRLGSTARTLLRHAHCPVEIAPHRTERHHEHEARVRRDTAQSRPRIHS